MVRVLFDVFLFVICSGDRFWIDLVIYLKVFFHFV